MKAKLTIQMEADLLREVQRLAANKGVSVSALLSKHFEQIVHNRETYERARKRALTRLREGLDLRWTPLRPRDTLHER
jgi:hypothetical protein